jgi:1,4-dihydroxy-2-naphthoyl-CoA hydrolase
MGSSARRETRLPAKDLATEAVHHGAPPEDNWTRTLGLRFTQVAPERVVAYLEASPQHHQPYGVLHGGVYASIVEAVASYGAGSAARAAGQRGVLGVSNSTDFYRSHSAGELMCVGTPVHEGRSAHVWQVEVTRSSDGKLVARGQVRFHVVRELPEERKQEYADLEGRD